jgi:dihydrofolate synthase/folylpolyglutamate synthase
MRYSTLSDWLVWQETLHPAKIDMGLDRVRTVVQRMDLTRPPYALVTVGGTNGKGSCVAMLEAMLSAAGYRVGVYTSPHLLRYNERVRVNRAMVGDEALCAAFARVDEARQDISLTYFEFGTLAALEIFSRAELDIVVLEVGMGGRLDAVNVLDADVSVVTTVAIDHSAWLGTDREAIGTEKAGIFRTGRPAVYGDDDPPASLVAHAHALGAHLHRLGREFGYEREMAGWSWWGPGRRRHTLPLPRLRGAYQLKNAATALMALALLSPRLPVSQQAVRAGLSAVDLPGRLQLMDDLGLRICDVAHNPHAASALAGGLKALPCAGRTHAVVGMLADKDAAGVISEMAEVVAIWHVAGLDCERGAAAQQLAREIRAVVAGQTIVEYGTVSDALAGAGAAAGPADRIVVFGSFYTVAAALEPRNDAWWRKAGSVQNERVSLG